MVLGFRRSGYPVSLRIRPEELTADGIVADGDKGKTLEMPLTTAESVSARIG